MRAIFSHGMSEPHRITDKQKGTRGLWIVPLYPRLTHVHGHVDIPPTKTIIFPLSPIPNGLPHIMDGYVARDK